MSLTPGGLRCQWTQPGGYPQCCLLYGHEGEHEYGVTLGIPRSLGTCPSCNRPLLASVTAEVVEDSNNPRRWSFRTLGITAGHNCLGRPENNFPLLGNGK